MLAFFYNLHYLYIGVLLYSLVLFDLSYLCRYGLFTFTIEQEINT